MFPFDNVAVILVPRGSDPSGQRRVSGRGHGVPIFPTHDKRDPSERGCVEASKIGITLVSRHVSRYIVITRL